MAKQFLTIDDQPNNAAIEMIDSDGRAVVLPLLLGSQVASLVLGNGTWPNQPLVWDGAAWIPSPNAVAVERHEAINDNSTFLQIPTPVLGFPTDVLLAIESATVINFRRDSTAGENTITFVAGSTIEALQAISRDAGDPSIGFLGATPVLRQVLTASLANQQAQIDDIVTALVNLGLVTDNRVP